MKKHTRVFLSVTFCILFLLCVSCENRGEKSGMDDIFFNELMDDSKTLEGNLTKEYDLNELRSFFASSNVNEDFGSNKSALMFNEVNSKYPVEIMRSGGYSVYKVSQGGYFYVFWMKAFVTDIDPQNGELAVYFSAYLPSSISQNDFDSLIPGVSTAKDVKKIDASFELSLLLSSGVFSYSFLNNQELLEIEYDFKDGINDYEDLIVKKITIISREDAPSRYSSILLSDLP